MLATITGAFGALKEAGSIVKTFNQLKTEAEIAEKTIELNQIIVQIQQDLFEAQAAYSALVAEKDELETQLLKMKNWAHEQQRYQLHQMAVGGLTYRIKESMRNGEPVHDLCTQCYENGIKSILQFSGNEKGHRQYSCFRCGNKVFAEQIPAMVTVIDIPEPRFPY